MMRRRLWLSFEQNRSATMRERMPLLFLQMNPETARPSLFVRDEEVRFISLRQLHNAHPISETR